MKLEIDINELINLYNNKHTKPLSECLEESAQLSDLSPTEYMDRIHLIILEEIKARSPQSGRLIAKEKLSAIQILAIKNAIVEQAFYTLYAGDYSLIIGFNPDTNSLADLKQLKARQFSTLAIKTLRNAGLLYAGLDGKVINSTGWWGF